MTNWKKCRCQTTYLVSKKKPSKNPCKRLITQQINGQDTQTDSSQHKCFFKVCETIVLQVLNGRIWVKGIWTALYYYFQLPVGLYLFQNKNVKKYDQPHSYQEKYKLK